MKNKLVTVSIPTYNSEKFIERCLSAIKNQSYKQIAVNIVDGGSKDRTASIAKKYNATLIVEKGSLMRARYQGVLRSKGDYILLLDSDQILARDAIENCIKTIEKKSFDMLVLEEDVWRKKTFLEKLFYYDRKLVHAIKDFNPYTSVLLPRFYKRELLLQAYAKVPPKVIDDAMPQDHAILYLESWKLSKKVGMVSSAVKHIEPSNFTELFRKFFRWGYFSKTSRKTPYDSYFNKRTERFRAGIFKHGFLVESFASILLLVIKGVPYKIGKCAAGIKRFLSLFN